MKVRCVCFDWGGVILGHARTWSEGCANAGILLIDSLNTDAKRDARRDLSDLYQVGGIGCEAFIDELTDLCDGHHTRADMLRLHDAWITEEYAGVDLLIDDLHNAARAETALLSNTNARHWATHLPGLDDSPPRFPTAGRLMHRFGSHLMELAKPDPAIYRAFEDATGFRAGEILFFDDRSENIAAAHELGWTVALVDHTGDTAAQMRAVLIAHGVLSAN